LNGDGCVDGLECYGPTHVWSKGFGGQSDENAAGIAVDAAGNVYVVGGYYKAWAQYENVDFGGGPLYNHGNTDAFLVKLDPDGTHVWSNGYGGPTTDQGLAVLVDGSQNVLVAGTTDSESVDFGGGELVNDSTANVFLAKFNPEGEHLWSHSYGGTFKAEFSAIAADGAGDFLVAGHIWSADVDFGTGPLNHEGSKDIFLAKIAYNGLTDWAVSFGGESGDEIHGLAVDSGGNIIVTGRLGNHAVDFGGGPLDGQGTTAVYVVRFNTDGEHLWSQVFAGEAVAYGVDVVANSLGEAYVAGRYSQGPIDCGGSALQNAGSNDIFLVNLGSQGNHIWSTGFGGEGGDLPLALAIGPDQDLYMAGHASSATVHFGGEPLANPWGLKSAFAARLTHSGDHVWTRLYPVAYAGFSSLAVSASGEVLFSGTYSATVALPVDFGGGALPLGKNVFVVKLAQ